MIWYILPPLDQLCEKCPVPRRCNETDPRCLRRLALTAGNVSNQKPATREALVLRHLKEHPAWHRTADIARAVQTEYKNTLYTLKKLKEKDQIAHKGKGRTKRWTAKPLP